MSRLGENDPRPTGEIIDGSQISGEINYNPDQELRCASEPSNCESGAAMPMNGVSRYPISIEHLDFGYTVRVGCQTFAVETIDKLIKNVEAYLKDPRGTEVQWMKHKKLL